MIKKTKSIILTELQKGITPKLAAKAISLGILIGIFPIIGPTTLMAFIIAYKFKLNQIIIQAVHYLLYPIQIILIPIYLKISITLFPSISPFGSSQIDLDKMFELFNRNLYEFLKSFGLVSLVAIVLWLFLSLLLYSLLVKVFTKILTKKIILAENSNSVVGD